MSTVLSGPRPQYPDWLVLGADRLTGRIENPNLRTVLIIGPAIALPPTLVPVVVIGVGDPD